MRFAKSFLISISALTAPVAGLPVDHHVHQTGHSLQVPAPKYAKTSQMTPVQKLAMEQDAMIVHKGMNPHHNAGQQEGNPNHFKYSFQHQEAHTDKIVSLEYHAERGPHVNILEPSDVHKCESHIRPDGNSTMYLTLSKESKLGRQNFKVGSIITSTGISCELPKGGAATLQERVIAPPTIHRLKNGEKSVELIIKPAQMHEMFKSMQVEYYRGNAEDLEKSRQKRVASAKAMGQEVNHPFKPSHQIIKDAKASKETVIKSLAASKVIAHTPKAKAKHHVPKAQSSNGKRTKHGVKAHPGNHRTGRKITSFKQPEFTRMGDGTVTKQGDCGELGDGMTIYHADYDACHTEYDPSARLDAVTVDGEGEDYTYDLNCLLDQGPEFTLIPGGQYILEFPYRSYYNAQTKLYLYEYDDSWWNGDDYCTQIPMTDEHGNTFSYDSFEIFGDADVNWFTIQMATWESLNGNSCLDDGWSYPEFNLKLQKNNNNGCYVFQTAELLGAFRLMQVNDMSLNVPVPINIDKEDEWTSGDLTLSYSVTCTDCKMDITGDAHVLIRTGNYHPFEEAWTLGNVKLDGKIDFTTVFKAEYSKTFEFDLLPKQCKPPTCYGTTICGMGVELGLRYGVSAELSISFDATITFNFKREMEQRAELGVHAWLQPNTVATYHTNSMYDLTDPEEDSPTDEEDDLKGYSIDVEINAAVAVNLMPLLDLGLWAGAGEGTNAHAAATLELNISAQIAAKAKFGYGDSSKSGIDKISYDSTGATTCKAFDFDETDKDNWGVTCCAPSGLPYCYQPEVCAKKHNVQIDLSFEVEASANLEIHAESDWGEWAGLDFTFTKTWYIIAESPYIKNKDDFGDEEPTSFFHMFFHVATACFSPVDESAHRLMKAY